MSLTTPGVWDAGVWESTVWGDCVWYEPVCVLVAGEYEELYKQERYEEAYLAAYAQKTVNQESVRATNVAEKLIARRRKALAMLLENI